MKEDIIIVNIIIIIQVVIPLFPNIFSFGLCWSNVLVVDLSAHILCKVFRYLFYIAAMTLFAIYVHKNAILGVFYYSK